MLADRLASTVDIPSMKTVTSFALALWLSSSAWAGDLSISTKGEAQLDDKATLKASNPAFDTEKPNIRFIVHGESVLLDNIKAWQAEAK